MVWIIGIILISPLVLANLPINITVLDENFDSSSSDAWKLGEGCIYNPDNNGRLVCNASTNTYEQKNILAQFVNRTPNASNDGNWTIIWNATVPEIDAGGISFGGLLNINSSATAAQDNLLGSLFWRYSGGDKIHAITSTAQYPYGTDLDHTWNIYRVDTLSNSTHCYYINDTLKHCVPFETDYGNTSFLQFGFNKSEDGGLTDGNNFSIEWVKIINFSEQKYALVNFTVYDEIKEEIIEDRYTQLEITSDTISLNQTINGSAIINLTTTPATEYRIRYTPIAYKTREYYITPIEQTGNIDAYSLSLTNSTDVTITINDGTGNPIENALVQLKKYFVSTNAYEVVAMAKTDFQGQAVLDVDFDDAFYQIFAQSGDVSINTIGSKIFSTSIEVTLITTENPFTTIDLENKITTSLAYNNNTETFSYTFQDAGGIQRKGTITVTKLLASGEISLCNNSTTSASATIICKVNATNSTQKILAVGKITANGETFITNILQVGKDLAVTFQEQIGNNGLFLTIMFAGTMAGLGIASPAISVLMFIVGLLGMVVMGFALINIVVYFIIVILGITVIWRLKN